MASAAPLFAAPTPSRHREPTTFAAKTNALAAGLARAPVYGATKPDALTPRQERQLRRVQHVATEIARWRK